MEKEFVPYEEALVLKELEFNEWCFGSYVKLTETQNTFFMNDVVDEIDRETPLHESLITKAPLYQQAFRWFREKYDLVCIITFDDDVKGKWFGNLYGHYETYGKYDFGYTELFKTYEEAELECLKKLIEIVKKK
jgi:hypothetical protein